MTNESLPNQPPLSVQTSDMQSDYAMMKKIRAEQAAAAEERRQAEQREYEELKARQREEERQKILPTDSPGQALRRGELRLDTVAEGDSVGVLRLVGNAYFALKTPQEMAWITAGHQELKKQDDLSPDKEPRATKIILAGYDETRDTLATALKAWGSERGAEQDEIILYGNMPDNLPEAQKNIVRQNISAAVKEFKANKPNCRLRAVCREYPKDRLNINQLRHDATDIFAMDAIERHHSFDHPMEVGDADTKLVGPTTTEVLAAKLTAPDSPYTVVHAQTNYLFDNPEAPIDDARAIAISEEVARRKENRELNNSLQEKWGPPHGDVDALIIRGYVEEWGSALALGPALMAGNYRKKGHLNEMSELLVRLEEVRPEIAMALYHAKPEVDINEVDTNARYFKGANVRNSGRRTETLYRNLTQAENERAIEELFLTIGDQQFGGWTNYKDFSENSAIRSDFELPGRFNFDPSKREEHLARLEHDLKYGRPFLRRVLDRYIQREDKEG